MPLKHNPRHISWDTCDVFWPPNVGFCKLASQNSEIQHWKGGNRTLCWNMGGASGVPTERDEDCVLEIFKRC